MAKIHKCLTTGNLFVNRQHLFNFRGQEICPDSHRKMYRGVVLTKSKYFNRFKLICRESFCELIPNRHERLFYFGRNGITFARCVLQVTFLLSIIYLSSTLVFTLIHVYTHVQHLSMSLTGFYISMNVIPIILMTIILLVCLPIIMTKLTLITSIEMMKDSQLIEKVISEQKMQRSKRSHRIF